MSKPVKDVQLQRVNVYRYRCCRCRHIFRYYPHGVGRAEQSERLKQYAALCWVLGLIYRHASLILSGWEVRLAHMTIWRDVQEQARRQARHKRRKPVRMVGLDGAYVRSWGGIRPYWSGWIWETDRWVPWERRTKPTPPPYNTGWPSSSRS